MRWRTLNFGEFAEVQPSVPLDRGEEYPFVPMEIVEPHCREVQPVETRVWNGGGGARFQNGDTIFARITPCLEHGKTAQIRGLGKETGFGSTEFLVFRGRPGVSDSDFIYYLARSNVIREPAIKSMVGASGRQRVQRSVIEEIPVRVPSAVDDQREIAEILSAYDDLIEDNRRRMALLEEAARLLYQEWFVRLRFPGHEHTRIVDGVPEGWERTAFKNALVLQRGFDLPVQAREDGEVPIYGSTGINGFHNKARVTGPGVVTGRSGTLGEVHYIPGDFWPLNTALWVKEFRRVTALFSLFLMREMDLKKYNGGVSVPTLDRKTVHKVEILVPAKNLLLVFDEFATPLFAQIETLTLQTHKLRAACALLLPRLMSGEIAV